MKTSFFKAVATSILIALFSIASTSSYAGNVTSASNASPSQQTSPSQQIGSYLYSAGYSVASVSAANDGSGNYIATLSDGRIIVITPNKSIVLIQNLPN